MCFESWAYVQDLKLGAWVSEAAAAAAGGAEEGAFDLFALAAHQHDAKAAYASDDRQGQLVRSFSVLRIPAKACVWGRAGNRSLPQEHANLHGVGLVACMSLFVSGINMLCCCISLKSALNGLDIW